MIKKISIIFGSITLLSAGLATTAFTFSSQYKSEFKKSIQKIINTTNVSAEAQILSDTNGDKVDNYQNESRIVNGVERSSTNANINYEYLLNKFGSMNVQDFSPQSDWVKLLNSDQQWDTSLIMEHQMIKSYGENWNWQTDLLTTNDVKLSDGKRSGSSSITSTLSTIGSIISILFGSDFTPAQASLLYQNTNLIFDMLGSFVSEDLLNSLISLLGILPNSDQINEMFANPFEKYFDMNGVDANNQVLPVNVNDVMTQVSEDFWGIFLSDKRQDINDLNIEIKISDPSINKDNYQQDNTIEVIKAGMQEQFGDDIVYQDGSGIAADYTIDFITGNAITNVAASDGNLTGETLLNDNSKIYVKSTENSSRIKGIVTLVVGQDKRLPDGAFDVNNSTVKTLTSAVNYIFMLLWYIQQFDNTNLITPAMITDVLSQQVTSQMATAYDRINISKLTQGLRNFLDPGYNYVSARGYVNIFLAIPETRDDFKPASNILIAPIFNILQQKSIWDSVINTHIGISNTASLPLEDQIIDGFKSANKETKAFTLTLSELDTVNQTAQISAVGYTGVVSIDYYTQSATTSYVRAFDWSDINISGAFDFEDIDFVKLIQDVLEWIKTPNSLPKNIVDMLSKSLEIIIAKLGDLDLGSLIGGDISSLYGIVEELLNEMLFASLTDPQQTPLLIGDVLYALGLFKNTSLPRERKIDLTGFSYISSLSGVKNDLFYALYDGGLFKSLFQLVNAFAYKTADDGTVIYPEKDTISQSIIEIVPDLHSLFNIQIGDVIEDLLGLDYDNNFQFLYGFKDMQLLDIFEALNQFFNPDTNGPTNNYYLDFGSIRNIFASFLKGDFSIKLGNEESAQSVNNIIAIIKALIAGMTNQSIEINGQQLADPKKAIIIVLGLSENGKSFIPNSIFAAISAAYGHGFDANNNPIQDQFMAENTIKIINGMMTLLSWFQNTSEAAYYNETLEPYINQQNWSTKYISSKNYEDIHQQAEIVYQLTYKNDKYRLNEAYQITLKRAATNSALNYGDHSFVITRIKRI